MYSLQLGIGQSKRGQLGQGVSKRRGAVCSQASQRQRGNVD